MTAIRLELPPDLTTELAGLGLTDDSRLSAWVADAIRERLSAGKQRAALEDRARRADRNAIRDVLAKVPDVEPAEEDRW